MRWVSNAGSDERAVIDLVASSDGLKAREIAQRLVLNRGDVSRLLHVSPFLSDLCYQDDAFCWHSYVSHGTPHRGLEEFCGWYGSPAKLMESHEDEWLGLLLDGCTRVGRGTSDVRGLRHSFVDARATLIDALAFVAEAGVDISRWEICFELRIRKARGTRIYADVLVVTRDYAFSLEFKMKDTVDPGEAAQAAKYAPYIELILGKDIEVIPALVLTRARDLYGHVQLASCTAEISVCSGDMLFNVFDEYLRFLRS